MGGRPRDPDLERRLLGAAWSLLTDGSYTSLTLSQVATVAGAHRSDVYRRWPRKSLLVADALAAHLPPIPDRDTGSLRSDIRAYVDALAQSWSATWIHTLVGWLADLADDREAEDAFKRMSVERGRPMREALDRAVKRGELPDIPDIALLGDLVEGPLMHRRMIGRGQLSAEVLESVAQTAYRVIAPAAALA